MITRKQFGEELLTMVSAGTLTSFALVAAPDAQAADDREHGCATGKDHCTSGKTGNSGDSCGNSGGKGQDKCRARVNDAACGADTCQAKGGSDVE